MKFDSFVAIIVLVICLGFAGCHSGSTDVSISQTGNSMTLEWDAPSQYTDGSSLAAGAIKEYRIYFSTSPGAYSTGSYYTVPAPATSVSILNIPSLGTGTYYFVVTSVDNVDIESDFSNEVSKVIG